MQQITVLPQVTETSEKTRVIFIIANRQRRWSNKYIPLVVKNKARRDVRSPCIQQDAKECISKLYMYNRVQLAT